jgi:hypothetical protein
MTAFHYLHRQENWFCRECVNLCSCGRCNNCGNYPLHNPIPSPVVESLLIPSFLPMEIDTNLSDDDSGEETEVLDSDDE